MVKKAIRFFYNRLFASHKSEVEKARLGGVKIGENCHIYSTYFDGIAPQLITIGNNVTITHSSLLIHDASTKKQLGYTKAGAIIIGNDVFIGWNSIIIGPVRIGDKVIIGAGCVVTKDIPSNSVVVGNPSRIICSYDDYIEKNRNKINQHNTFPHPMDEMSKNTELYYIL